MSISANFTSVYSQEWEINFLQCYPNGYLKYTDLCNIFQLTAGFHAELGGISFTDMQHYNQAWVLSRMRVEINNLPKWRDVVTVKTWIKSLENSRSIRCLEMYLGTEKIIGCETFWAVFNTNTRRPENLALPNEHFEKFPNHDATLIKFSKINSEGIFENSTQKKVALSDLDIINHANSVKYLEWCLDTTDINLIINLKIKSLEMNYLKEVALGEKLEIKVLENEDIILYKICKNEAVCFALKLEI
ncbi:MAG: acyl-[acyl-carrier-protein] thioesterase [Flavobacterium sp.]|nr:acyl-[acyl-carrier-protein] thioesterase [Flavobacterium sp.]